MHSLIRDSLPFVLALVVAVIAGSLATSVSPILLALVVAAPAFVALFLTNLRAALLVLLVMRSNIDAIHGLQIASAGDLELNAAAIVGLALMILGAYYILANRVNIFRSPVAISYAIFLAVCLVGLVVSSYPSQTISDWLRLASVFMFYVLLLEAFHTNEDIGKIVLAYFVSSVLPVLMGLYQFATDQGVYVDGFHRVYGTFVVPPVLAFYLVGLLPLSIVYLVHTRAKSVKVLMAIWICLMLIDLVATYTRGAWIGVFIALSMLAFWRYRALLIILPVLLIALAVAFPQTVERFGDLNEVRPIYGYSEANTFAWRTRFWFDTVLANSESSLFVGAGLGAIKQTYYTDPHNDYLRLYVETGVLGTLSYLAVLVSLFATAAKTYRLAMSRLHKDLAAAFVAVFLAYVTMSIADNIVLGPALQWYFWTQAALVRIALELSRSSQSLRPAAPDDRRPESHAIRMDEMPARQGA